MTIDPRNVFESLEESGGLPWGWRRDRSKVRKVKIKNRTIATALNEVAPGEWRKVYAYGVDGAEVHYFEDLVTGRVWNVKVK